MSPLFGSRSAGLASIFLLLIASPMTISATFIPTFPMDLDLRSTAPTPVADGVPCLATLCEIDYDIVASGVYIEFDQCTTIQAQALLPIMTKSTGGWPTNWQSYDLGQGRSNAFFVVLLQANPSKVDDALWHLNAFYNTTCQMEKHWDFPGPCKECIEQ